MSRFCPKCGCQDTGRERRPNGKTTCNACGYSVLSSQWDKEEAEVEFLAEPTVSMCQEEITKLQALVVSLQDHIDSLVIANESVHQDSIGNLLDYGEEKHENEKLELEIEDLKRKLTTTEMHYEAWKAHDLLLQSKHNALLCDKAVLDLELEHFRINAIESYELKLPAHKNTYIRAVAGLKAATKSESNESDAAESTKETKKDN